jgi:transcriptional repressor NrdR
MRCPFCGHDDTQVKDSRPAEEDTVVRRRRQCPECENRFTTFERVEVRPMTIVKKSGRKTPFEREKLLRSVDIALRKRNVDADRIERMVSDIVRKLESMGEAEIPSEKVGQLVMEGLKDLDQVAYVRYASVYRDFGEVDDFGKFLSQEKLGGKT